MVAGLCIAQGAPASAACVALAGTADGFDKETAVSRAPICRNRRYGRWFVHYCRNLVIVLQISKYDLIGEGFDRV